MLSNSHTHSLEFASMGNGNPGWGKLFIIVRPPTWKSLIHRLRVNLENNTAHGVPVGIMCLPSTHTLPATTIPPDVAATTSLDWQPSYERPRRTFPTDTTCSYQYLHTKLISYLSSCWRKMLHDSSPTLSGTVTFVPLKFSWIHIQKPHTIKSWKVVRLGKSLLTLLAKSGKMAGRRTCRHTKYLKLFSLYYYDIYTSLYMVRMS